MIPVTGNLIKVALCHKGSLGKLPTSLLLLVLNKTLKQLNYSCTLGKKDGKTLTDKLACGKELKLTAELVVVTLLCFLYLLEVCVKLLLLGEGCTVDTGKHLTVGVTSPVCACSGGELVRLDGARREKVRTCAQVNKITLLVEGDRRIFGKVVYKLNLVGLILLFHKLKSLVAGKCELLQLLVLLNYLLHLTLDLGKICRCKLYLRVDVIVEAVVNGGTDGKLCLGIKSLYCLCKHVAGCMPEHLFTFDSLKGNGVDRISIRHLCCKVNHVSVDLCGYHLTGDKLLFL